MSADALAWLDAHAPATPAALRDSFADALGPHDGATGEGASVAESLALAALALYGRVLEGTGLREDALVLLAADALFTHAFQAQAEADPENLSEFAIRWGGGGAVGRLAEERMSRRADAGS